MNLDSTCRVASIVRPISGKCNGDYSSSNEDYQSWYPGWTFSSDNTSYSQSIENAFIYQSGSELQSYRYSGIMNNYDNGGYVYEFRGRLNEMNENLTELHQLSWIDSSTRAIIIEITLYNPNVQLFTSVIFLIEFLSTGGVFPQSKIQPIDYHNEFQDFSSLINVIFGIIFILFIIYFTLFEIYSLIDQKAKYLFSFWNLIQWSILICSWTGLGIYIWRSHQGSHLDSLFKETNGYKFINIQQAVYLDETLMILFGYCYFFSTLKYLYFFRFNSRFSQFGQTLQYIKQDLFWFTCNFILIFISFLSLFYSKLATYSDVYRTIQMLFQMLLLKYNTRGLYQADSFLGPFTFTLFIFIIVFICFTMFSSIIMHGFRHVRYQNKRRSNQDEDFLLFMFKKMKRTLGRFI